MTERSFIYNNTNVVYRLEGKGKPVVLLHGFGEDGHIWDEQVNFLKEHCLLIVPDLPGSGGSQLLETNDRETPVVNRENTGDTTHASRLTSYDSSISIDDYSRCILSLLQHEGIDNCIMLGHSMGGYIVLAFAERYPEMLGGIGLINSTAFADTDEKKKTRQRAIDTIGRYGAFPFLKTTIPTLFGAAFKEKHPERVEGLITAGKDFSNEALQQYYRAMMNRPDRREVLKSNPLPVLFVMGTEDAAAPMNDVLQQTPLPDKSYIYILEDVGHMSMLEAPEQLNSIMLAFINQ